MTQGKTTTATWAILHERVAEFFTPSAPIDHVDLFAGRWEQLLAIKDAVITKGQHAIVFGERGVGKTSLVSVVAPLMKVFKVSVPLVVRQNCGREDSFAKVWKRALGEVIFSIQRRKVGFEKLAEKDIVTLAQRVSDTPTPDEIVAVLRQLQDRLVFVFDEFDQLPDATASKPFADTIKALSDYAASATVIIVGVGDDVAGLLESHASVERALVQIHVPRMHPTELEEILTKVSSKLGTDFASEAAKRIVDFSQGLPHYVHLLGLYATRAAIMRQSLTVTTADVDKGAATAVSKVPQSTLDAYRTAVDSPQKDALFRHVLLACALTRADDRGYFAPADIRPALKAIGRELDIQIYASHLKKFASEDRGNILQKVGRTRKYRYRFRYPLMQPYVVMRGLADKLITMQQIESLLAPARESVLPLGPSASYFAAVDGEEAGDDETEPT